MAEKTTATKRKAAPKRKPAAKKPKSVVRSNMRSVENKAAAVERKVRTTARKAEKQIDAAEKATEKFADRAQDVAHNAVLATLGFYGKAYDQAQEQFDALQDQLQERRRKAFTAYADLIKRGEKLEKEAKGAIKDLDLDSLTDRKKLEKQLDKAKARFSELKKSVRLKAAA
jgi:hypothetical protein